MIIWLKVESESLCFSIGLLLGCIWHLSTVWQLDTALYPMHTQVNAGNERDTQNCIFRSQHRKNSQYRKCPVQPFHTEFLQYCDRTGYSNILPSAIQYAILCQKNNSFWIWTNKTVQNVGYHILLPCYRPVRGALFEGPRSKLYAATCSAALQNMST